VETESILYIDDKKPFRANGSKNKKNIGLLIKSKQTEKMDKEREKEQKLTRERFFEIDNGYFMKAFNIQTEANQNFERANYDLCIRRSQEAFELYLKSIFLFLNRTHRREHDIGKELYDIRIILNRYGISDTEIAKMVKESKTLAEWRETALYGDETLKTSNVFDKKDAELGLSYVQNIHIIGIRIKSEILKKCQ